MEHLWSTWNFSFPMETFTSDGNIYIFDKPNNYMRKNYNLKVHKDWRQIILKKFNNKCIICEGTNRLTAHHLITAHNEKFTLNNNNGIPLCATHHTRYSGPLSPHNDRAMEFFIWLNNNYPYIVKWVEDNYDI